MRSRLGLVSLIVVGASLAFTAAASACQDVHLSLPESAGPGDIVPYSISGISHGATYSFTIATPSSAPPEAKWSKEISGANTNPNLDVKGDNGTFTMPDLGSEQLTITANGSCSCPEDANPQGISASMEYLPPPPAEAPSPPATSHENPPGATTPASVDRQRQPRLPAPSALATHAAKNLHHVSPATSPVVGSPPLHSVGGPSELRNPNSGSAEANAKQGGEKASSAPAQVVHALGSTTRVGPADVPTIGLLAIALIVIAAGGLAAFAIYLWRNGPDPSAAVREPAPSGPDPVEEELQQMIADEMARQLLSDLELGKPTQVSLK